MKHYPMLFEPIYKEMVWGGAKLAAFGRKPPFEHTGESWDISCRAKEMGVVENGLLAGKLFSDVINADREGVLGAALAGQKDFPLLVKIIDAADNLSVQAHPGDEYARRVENVPYGKTEMWYVLEAPTDGALIIGLEDGVSREAFGAALAEGNPEPLLRRLPVGRGDVVSIPSGLVHAITSGTVVAEIQQNSDITYRVYDYNRLGLDGQPRELHVEKAMEVVDFDGTLKKEVIPGLTVKKGKNTQRYLIANPYFEIIEYDVTETMTETTDPDRFWIYTCVEGAFSFTGGGVTTALTESRSVYIPAGMGALEIFGQGKLLKSFVPNVEKDFVAPLRAAGYTDEEIAAKTGK